MSWWLAGSLEWSVYLVPLTIGKLIDSFSTGAVCPFCRCSLGCWSFRKSSLACHFLLLQLLWLSRSALGLFAMLVCFIKHNLCQTWRLGRAIIMKLSGLRIIARIRSVHLWWVMWCWLSEIKHTYHRYVRSRNSQIVQLEISSQDSVSILVFSENLWLATYRMVYGKPHLLGLSNQADR